ncbi:GNAT family N-acetyltransferase [Paenibacillus radicis (ex Gao et al. 2016)]|uniref:Acetyltransferase n=1 Tax=Paenibacillus radicis (ex Gao et al. 2016) TaxID=1737354 RepID=A0A917HG70_9BACL|nr:GNAT family N-acetyltransferase [Paenibacillus radicis (ex Gao et al. 2016)]GGG78210.1 acetyltransferase [Paenibacillus radicis (ex Gao et al. 2016)]
MTEKLLLVKPTVDLQLPYVDFYEEWKQSGEDLVPWVIGKDPSDFRSMVQFLLDNEKEGTRPYDQVPDSTFWLLGENSGILGAVNIRHRLTDKLLQLGGHIGYGIRPTQRRKGYATALLALALIEAKKLGISKALVVCDADNIGSERTILSNGGIPDVSFTDSDGSVVKRFWIET